MPFEEVAHTADWSIRVWAQDLRGLLTESARGMYALANAEAGEGPRMRRKITLEAVDAEGLLVVFLEELRYLAEAENLIFDDFSALELEGSKLSGMMEGSLLRTMEKEIKAVTFHNLAIRHTERGLEVEIVFDV